MTTFRTSVGDITGGVLNSRFKEEGLEQNVLDLRNIRHNYKISQYDVLTTYTGLVFQAFGFIKRISDGKYVKRCILEGCPPRFMLGEELLILNYFREEFGIDLRKLTPKSGSLQLDLVTDSIDGNLIHLELEALRLRGSDGFETELTVKKENHDLFLINDFPLFTSVPSPLNPAVIDPASCDHYFYNLANGLVYKELFISFKGDSELCSLSGVIDRSETLTTIGWSKEESVNNRFPIGKNLKIKDDLVQSKNIIAIKKLGVN